MVVIFIHFRFVELCAGPTFGLLGCNFDADKRAYLSLVSLCFQKDDNGNPTTQVACPDDCITNEYDNGCIVAGATEVYVQRWTWN